MVSNREGFQKTYDLTERVLPPHISTVVPSIDEFATHIVDQQLRCHGLVSLKGFTYLRRNVALRRAVKTLLDERLADGTLEQIEVSNGEVFFIKSGDLERTLPRLSNRLTILSPFDNVLIQRERIRALFNFDYQIECYVPAAKRQYGYFSLPLLFRGQFVGRMDCKAHRKTAHLEIKSLHFEEHGFDEDVLIRAFVEAIQAFSAFQQCESLSLTKAYPKCLIQPLRSALKSVDRMA